MNTNQPFDTIRVGRIKATIWENENPQGGVFHSVTFVRNYRDENSQWQETNSFSLDDIPRMRMASDKAYEKIYERLEQLWNAKKGNSQASEETQMELEQASASARKKAAKKKSATQKILDEREKAAKSR